ncbi:hypothetical protein [Nocardia asteroides]|uniref:Lipoprotein n=1 Tax=Nocardia asteroides NBRC 15531 TaxID=1110697 RepID=U5E8B6_NOCAS|nr:hypothetical protein [Nocardia asteroides]TLF69944.1 hypothetical protein FEK33_06750 [Nocardia asteroides NBRC 15531]UGT49459.1 hypothetical protein LT345_02230 [Nocardia asteroides]SFL91117.1 hypothetical protein SAMN05444423_1011368 [Nocardia asteroides]VEG37988.1 Uncharacterised protein [Nocardia asteroides]GAD82656.1 hypothetical protein NCAST_12_00080 [Nocardia asteroides NBRC 15531]
MRRQERVGVTAALTAAATGLILVACTNQVPGDAQANQADLASYTSEVAASSAARVEKANDTACDGLRAANKSSVTAFNAYIDASNSRAPDTDAKADEAVTTLRNNAKDLGRKITNDVIPSLATPLRAYRDNTNTLADTLERRAPTDELNGVIDTFNAAKDTAIDVCKPYGN